MQKLQEEAEGHIALNNDIIQENTDKSGSCPLLNLAQRQRWNETLGKYDKSVTNKISYGGNQGYY